MKTEEKEAYIAYLQSRKTRVNQNGYKLSLKEIEKFQSEHPDRPMRVLLHACCIVCGCWPIDFFLEHHVQVDIYYANSNIWPQPEYEKRLEATKKYLKDAHKDSIHLIIPDYDYETYSKVIIPHRAEDPEGWKSCWACYKERMRQTRDYGEAHGYDYFATTLTFSRQKDSYIINEIGKSLEDPNKHIHYLISDFKKADGALKSDHICNLYNIYRQDYCGCETSYIERHPDKQKKV